MEKIFLPVFDSKQDDCEENGEESSKELEQQNEELENGSPVDCGLVNKKSIEDSIMERLRMTANEQFLEGEEGEFDPRESIRSAFSQNNGSDDFDGMEAAHREKSVSQDFHII